MAVLTLEEYKKRNDNSNTNDVSTVNGNRILTLDEFKNTSQYKSIQDRINQKTNNSTKLPITKKESKNKWKNSLNDGYDFGDITKTVLGTAGEVIPRVAKDTFEAGKEVVKHPIKSTKTLGVGIAAGADKADDALNNALTDFSNWLLKKKKDNKPHLSLKEYDRLVETGTEEEKQLVLEQFKNAYGENSEEYKFYAKMFNIKDTRSKAKKTTNEIINPKYYKTETYKQIEKGNLSEEQEKVWNIGTNIGNMLPSMVVSTVAAPIAGSAMFYVQSQQNYTEEAKARGYDDKKARIYGLIMGGVETGIERLGFDQLGGLGKLAEGNTLKAMGGEALEEFATPYVDLIVRNTLGEKYKLSEAVEESITGAVYGAVVGGIMNMGGKGIVTVDNVVNKINNNQQITSQEMTQAINDIQKENPNYFEEIMQEVPEVIKNTTNSTEATTNEIIPTVQDIVNQERTNQDINLPNRDNINPQNNVYQYQTSGNEKIDNLRKSAVENNFNNSESTINYMNMLEQIINDKNVDILFDPNLKDSQGRMANGKYENGVITINPNSNRAGEFIAIHELTHAIGTDSMQNIIQKYRNSNAEFDAAVQQLLKNYDITELNEEAMADVAGQLFGNQEFINNLSRTQPSLFRKLYNEIKYLWHQFRGYKNQNEFIEDLQYKWEKAYRSNNELNNGSFESKKLNGYYPELNVNTNNISKFNIKNINNLSEVQDKIYDYYKDKYISTEQLSKPIKNIDTDMNIEIWKNGIMETFGNKDYYKNLTKEEKLMKLATMDNLAKMIKYGEIRAKDAPNKHNPNSPARYYYLEHPININGINYMVNMDIRKVPNTNGRFYIHSIDTKKIGASKDLKTSRLTAPTANNIPQINENVKSDTSSTKYSIQESQNNTQELNNSSFSNAKRYNDLSKTNRIEYFTRSDGKVRVYMLDSNNNLVNEIDLINNTEAIKELGNKLGNQIYETANETSQYIEIGNDVNNLGTITDYFMNHRPTETGAFASDITDNGNLAPADMYTHPEYYFNMDESHQESIDILRKIRNKPNAEIKIYRATPGNEINVGDWVTLSKKYAEHHNNSQLDGKGNVLEKVVKAKDIQFAGDDINEFGYYPDMPKYSKTNKAWQSYLEENFESKGTKTNFKDVLLPTQKDINKVNLPTNEDINLRSLEETAPAIEQEEIAPIKERLKKIEDELGYIPRDPTKESSYDDADAPNFWELDKNEKSNLDNEIDEFKRAIDRQLQEATLSPKEIKKNNDLKSQLSEMYSKFQEQFINRNYEIDKYSKLTGNKEIMFKGDMLNNVAGEVTGDINIGQTDNYGRQIGESLNSLFKKSKKNGYYEQFDDYLKHYSNIDRHAYGKGSIVPLEYSQKMVQVYEKTIPGIKNDAQKVWQYGKNMLSNMEENGLISKDFKTTLEDMYPHYVPYMQSESMVPYMDDSGEIKPKKVIKRADGKAHDLITVEEALEKYTYAQKKAIRQNDLYKEIIKTSKEKVFVGGDERADPTQLNNSLIKDIEGNGYLTAYIDGNVEQAKISDALYQELAKTNELRLKDAESKYAPILKPLQKVSEIRRNILTTWNPSFLLTNSMKDIQDGLLNSKYTMDMAKNYPGAFYELATQSTDTARQFSALYGSGMVMGEYQIDRLTNSTKNLDIKQMNKIMQAIPNLNEIIELTPRYAEFKASLEHGTSVTEAMYNARELTTNFGRGGYITKALNRNGFTFLNASVQGFDKMIRNFTGANGAKGVAVGITGVLTKVTVLGIAPALFNAAAFGAGDDDEDESYKALPNYIKDNYYLFKVKGLGNKTSKYYDGTFLRIPKGRVLSIFGSAARRTLEYAKGDKNAFDGYLKNVDSQIGINNPEENNIFAPIKQAFGSKNGEAWYGGDIIPKRLQNKPEAEQYDESTDEFSKWLGKILNISPYKINYLVDQYSGGAGDIVLPMITKETTNGATTATDYLMAPIKDKFIVNSTDDNKYASNFYSSLEQAQIKANGEKSKVEDKLKYKYMSSISSDMSKLYKEKREIQLDDSLSKKQKYKKVQNVQKEINRLAEEGTKDYKVKDLKSNYGKIANKEYYKNNKNEWSVIKDEESADLNSMKMTANEKNKYFIAKNKISSIKQQDIDSKLKKSKISDIVLKTNLSDEKMAYLYGRYYSKEETLDIIQDAGISIKEFIKFDSQDIESDYYANGKAVPNSKKKKTIAYINSLNLSAIQKAMLIRMEYSSFTSYDRQIIQYVNNQKLNSEDKKAIYEKLGFKIRNGRVYSK